MVPCAFVVVVQSLSHVRLFVTPWTAARQSSLSFITSQSLLKFMSIESVMPFNHLILCHPLLLLHISGYWHFSRQSLILAWASFSPAFLMMCSACKLNKQSDNIQPWHTPFPIWNQTVVLCPVLTVASWPVYRFCRRQVRFSGIPMSWRIFHSLLWLTQSKALA